MLEPEGHRTGIFKDPVEEADVGKLGIVGDQQADRRYHGGPEKALHQFSVMAYEMIVSEYPQLAGIAIPGSMGENISSNHLADSNVCIGDCYRIGEVLVQVSQPRSPCWKINHRFSVNKLSLFVERQRITGWYYRVLETGHILSGDSIRLVERVNEGVSIDYFQQVYKQHRPELAELDKLIVCKGLNEEWRSRLSSRRKYLETAAS